MIWLGGVDRSKSDRGIFCYRIHHKVTIWQKVTTMYIEFAERNGPTSLPNQRFLSR